MENKMLENLSLKTKLKTICLGSLLVIAPFSPLNIKAQSPGIVLKTVNFRSEDLLRPMNTMMEKIYNIKMSGDFDKDYVSIMREFQQGGIDLCKIYAMSGEDAKLLENAKVSSIELKEDQKQLKGFYSHYQKTIANKNEPDDLMHILNKMMKEMDKKGRSGNLNNDYASVMVLFNWANTEMAKAELRNGSNNELKNKAADLIEEFSCHENTLVQWLDKSVAEN